jgi:nickel superoxide dismutase
MIMKHLNAIIASAHCDIPCGIYEPTLAKIAGKTVARMIQQINELKLPPDVQDAHAMVAYMNSISRRIKVKEEHAEVCKKELEILWSDFFKPEHLENYPDLHTVFWSAIKLASKCKQDSLQEDAENLLEIIDNIARIFYEIKHDKDRFGAYKKITDNLY